MGTSKRWLVTLVVMLATTGTAHAISGSASGGINAGSDQNDAAGVVEFGWDGVFNCRSSKCDVTGTPCDDFSDCPVGPDSACVPLGNGIIVQDPNPPNEFFTFFFDVLPVGPAGTTQANLNFQFNVDLTSSTFSADFTIAGETTQTGGGSAGGSVFFFIPGGTGTPMPVMGQRSVITMVAGLLAVGVFLIFRRLR